MIQPKDFGFGEEETMLRDSARRLLEDRAGVETLRRTVAGSHEAAYSSETQPASWDEGLWQQMVELGWTGIAAPESSGGSGMKMVAVAALAEEIGRAALPSPLLATLLATRVLAAATVPSATATPAAAAAAAAARTLAAIVEGRAATLAVTDAAGSWEVSDSSVTAKPSAEGFVLSGTAHFVQDARKSSLFVVSAQSGNGLGLFVVETSAPGVSILPDQIVDLTRDQARVAFEAVEVPAESVIAQPGTAEAVLTAAMPDLLTIVAADMCGAAKWQLHTTTEYAKIRTQFDRPLGFFQAVKHPLVNMMIDIDRALSLVYNAACAIDSQPERAEYFARMAKAAASDAAAFCSERSVQLHGGIGFTWECDVHLWFKRQLHNQAYLGDGAYQRARLAELVDTQGT